MRSLLTAIGVFLSLNASAAEWSSAVWFGLTHSGKTDSTVKVNGTEIGSVTSKGTSAFAFGAESFRRTEFPINLAIIVENNWYGNEGEANDFTTSLLLGPRVETGTKVNLWAEIGVGPALTAIGTTSATMSGLTVAYDSSTAFSFAISPRVGVDFPIGDNYFIGLQAAYFTSSLSLDGQYSGLINAPFTQEATRKYFTTVLRFGWSIPDEDEGKQVSQGAPVPPMPPADESTKKLDAEELMKLKKLRDAGALTEKEYQEQKAKLLK